MLEIEPAWVSALATVFAGIATFLAAVAACLAYKLQRSVAKSRLQLLKGDNLIRNFQALIVTFGDIHATAREDWSDERTAKLSRLSRDLRYTKTVIESMNSELGRQVENWYISKDAQGNSVPSLVEYVLGQLGATVGDKYDEFLFGKAKELRIIQDGLFKDMSA